MKYSARLLFLVCVLLLAFAQMAGAQVDWNGISWSTPAGSAVVDVDGNLIVTATGDISGTGLFEGAAHWNTSAALRASTTPWVEVTFIDSVGTGFSPMVQMWMEREDTDPTSGVSPYASWARLGTGTGESTRGAWYGLWWNEATDDVGRFYGAARSEGTHTAKLGMRADGKVDFWIDGNLLGTTNPATDFQPDYFGDIYLAGLGLTSGESVTFTNFQYGTDYSGPSPDVPEPMSIMLGVMGLGSLAGFRKLRQK